MNPMIDDASKTEKVPVSIRASLEKPPAAGTVEIVTWSPKARSKRAMKFLGIAWGLGLFCVLIPLVHFVAVPALFIAGIIGFARMSGQDSLILGGEGTCPECGKTFRIAKATNRFPMDDLCEHCRTSVSISRPA